MEKEKETQKPIEKIKEKLDKFKKVSSLELEELLNSTNTIKE